MNPNEAFCNGSGAFGYAYRKLLAKRQGNAEENS